MGIYQALHELEVSELRLEIQKIQDSADGLDALVASTIKRATKAENSLQRSSTRGKTTRAERNEHWRAKICELRDSWKQSAVEDVEAAHGAVVVRLKELKAQALTTKRAAVDAAARAEKLSDTRLAKMREADELASELQERVDSLEAMLHEGAADAVQKLEQIRALKTASSGTGHARSWPWFVRAMVINQLVNGTPPTAIPGNITSDAAYLVPFLEVHVPSVDFCRRMRGELRIVSETLAAYRIAKAVNWRQLFTDGTSRRQTALLTAIIAIDGPNGELVPVILRGAFVARGETSEDQVADILERAVMRGAAKLTRLRAVFEELFPGVPHEIPDSTGMDIAKLGGGGAICSDNCNGALKVKRLFKEAVEQAVKDSYDTDTWGSFTKEQQSAKLLVLEIDCWNHLRNVWLGAATAALTGRLKENLKEELEAIDFRLRVGTDLVLVLRAADKEFSLSANYPKGHGDLFREWIQRVHPKALLFHVIRTQGSRQDLAFDGARALYMNRVYWAEFLDERLRVAGASNILQECLFILLTSVEMIASTRVHAIIDLAIVLPMRWLSGNSHLLAEYGWSERSMGTAIDILERAMESAATDGTRMLDEVFMMGIFKELEDKLPPFKEYLSYMYDEKKMSLAGSSITEHQFARLRAELFHPTDEDNKDSTEVSIELGALAATTILTELRDPKKATSRHLTSTDGKLSWGNTSIEEHTASMRKIAVNDPAESIFGGFTRELQVFGRIGFGAASGISMSRRNRDFALGVGATEKRETKTKGGKAKPESKGTGLFYSLAVEIREALITMASRDYHSELAVDRADLAGQRAAKQRKEELAGEHGREKALEQYIDALYYHEMWGSAACWKTAEKADAEYAKLGSKSAKLEAVKEQIRIRVQGLGWKDLSCAWSADGKAFPPNELLEHLKMLIKEQSRRIIPSKPPPPGLARKELATLGKRTGDMAALDAREANDSRAVEAAARAEKTQRESKGFGDSYQQRQGSKPELDGALVGKRVEVVVEYTLTEGVFIDSADGKAVMWCSGEVIDVDPRPYSLYTKGKSATIRWDANDRVAPPEPSKVEGCKLLPTMWNRDGVGAWRFDLDPPPPPAAP